MLFFSLNDKGKRKKRACKVFDEKIGEGRRKEMEQ